MTKAAKPKRDRKVTRKTDAQARPAAQTEAASPNGASSETQCSPSAKAETKTSRVLALLQRPEGASVNELVAETGWQPHTTRAALTGLNKKGHGITSEKVDGTRRYRAGAAQ